MQNTETKNGIIKNENVYGINQSTKQTKYTRFLLNSIQRELENYIKYASNLVNGTDELLATIHKDLIDLKKMLDINIENNESISMENYYRIMQRFYNDGTTIRQIFKNENQLFKNVDKFAISEDSFTQIYSLHDNVKNLNKSYNHEINLCENSLSKQKLKQKA